VLKVAEFGSWNGVGRCSSDTNRVIHRSIPYGLPPKYPDPEAWLTEHRPDFECSFILTTRDLTLSEISRSTRFPKPIAQLRLESRRARELMSRILTSGERSFVFSYESLLFLQKPYLDLLYDFIGVCSDFIPDLQDANQRRIKGNNPGWLETQLGRLFRRR
jgi:hypothetical protein